METLAIVLAILFVGQVIDMKDDPKPGDLSLLTTAGAFGGALTFGIFVAVTG